MSVSVAALRNVTLLLASGCYMVSGQDLDTLRSGVFYQGPQLGRNLRIVNWNIDRGLQLDRIMNGLRRLNPDICLLQEVDLHARRTGGKDIAEELAKALGMNYVFASEFQELGQGSKESPAFHGQAILSKLPIQRPRILRFEHQSGFWKPRSYLPDWAIMQRRSGGRLALAAEFDVGGSTLIVYNLHLESRSYGRIQYLQLDEVVQDSKRYTNAAIVLGGDLNTKYFPSIFVSHLEQLGFTNCLKGAPRTHAIYGSLDWIFLHGAVECEKGHVFRDIHGSDHYPVLARVAIRTP